MFAKTFVSLVRNQMSTWSPLSLTKAPYAVLVLNLPIEVPNFNKLWNDASIRVCVDGGTNRVYDLKPMVPLLKNPDLITGDFDSARPEVRSYYEKLGVKVLHTPDQDFTDFTKALQTTEEGITTGDFPQVDSFITTDGGGRLDQVFANLCTLFKTKLKVFLINEISITWLLPEGTHEITLDAEYAKGNKHCGIIPLCGVTKLKTRGLKWNLDGEYHFHGIVSTNNLIVDTVHIETNADVLWTMDSA